MRKKTWRLRRLSFLLVAVLIVAIAVPAYAQFGKSVPVASNSLSTATLEAPTGLSASASCESADSARIVLDWTATSSNFADGYDIYRASNDGGPYTKIDHVTGRATSTYTNNNLPTSSTYYYVVQSTANNWTSINSNQAQATTPDTCP